MNDAGWGELSTLGSQRRQEGGAERPAASSPCGECSTPFLSWRLQLLWIADGGRPRRQLGAKRCPSPEQDLQARCWRSQRSR